MVLACWNMVGRVQAVQAERAKMTVAKVEWEVLISAFLWA
jgi:hypothetical protein